MKAIKIPLNRKGCTRLISVVNSKEDKKVFNIKNDNVINSSVVENDSSVIRVPMSKISPGRIVCYTSTEQNRKSFRYISNKIKLPMNTGARPHPSKKTSRIIRDKVNWFLLCTTKKKTNDPKLNKTIAYQLTFVTLTLSSIQVHTNNELKEKLINQFITEIKKRYKVENYIWRMESQGNLNAHFHFVIDKYINHYELRQLWNRLQNKLGYVDRYRDKMKEQFKDGFSISNNKYDKRTVAQQEKAYKENIRTDWAQHNSTDIHSIYNISNIAGYLGKYFSKEISGNREKIKRECLSIKKKDKCDNKSISAGVLKFLRHESQIGRIWGCSINLSKLKGVTKEVDSQVSEILDRLIIKKDGKRFNKDYFSVYFFDTSLINKKDYKVLFNWIFEYIIDTIGYFST
jgi:hypothetical protein